MGSQWPGKDLPEKNQEKTADGEGARGPQPRRTDEVLPRGSLGEQALSGRVQRDEPGGDPGRFHRAAQARLAAPRTGPGSFGSPSGLGNPEFGEEPSVRRRGERPWRASDSDLPEARAGWAEGDEGPYGREDPDIVPRGHARRDIGYALHPRGARRPDPELLEDRGQYYEARPHAEADVQAQARARRRGRWQREPLTARELMTKNPHGVRPDAPLTEVARVMREEDCGIVPVVDEGRHLLGVVTDRDLVVRAFAEGQNPAAVRVRDVMTEDLECAHPDEDVHSLIHLMARARVRRVPVVDREDRLVGIVTMGDLATRADQDEELQEALERISARRSFWRGG